MSELRLAPGEAERLREKFPGRVPVFVFRAYGSRDIPDLTKHKFLVPTTMAIGSFTYTVRKQLALAPEKALFLFINNTLPTTSATIGEMYSVYKGDDGALRFVYTSENTFGYSF